MPFMEIGENKGSGFFVHGQNDPNLSNEAIVLAPIDAGTYPKGLPPGTVLGKITRGAQQVNAAALGGNTGNGVFNAAPTADAGTAPGRYQARLETEAANGGTFAVFNPAGQKIGEVAVGAAYDGPVNFQINDGATDFKEGDTFNIDVGYAATSGSYGPHDPDATDGRADVDSLVLLWHAAAPSNAAQKNVAVARHQVVNGSLLSWPVTVDAAEKAAAEAGLAKRNVMVRY